MGFRENHPEPPAYYPKKPKNGTPIFWIMMLTYWRTRTSYAIDLNSPVSSHLQESCVTKHEDEAFLKEQERGLKPKHEVEERQNWCKCVGPFGACAT